MSPKEKAIELSIKMRSNLDVFKQNLTSNRKALIVANELIESTFSKKWYDNNEIIPADYLLTEYWQEVKQEIEKTMTTRIFTPELGWHDLKVYSSEEVIELLEKAKESTIDEIIKTIKI